VETNQETCGQSLEVHQSAIDAIVADEGNVVKQGEVSVHIMTLSKEDPFDFDSVQHLPLSILVEEFPLVLEMIYQEGSDKCFVRVKADLNFYDGVSALHTGFNLLEYLDTTNTTKVISPYPFTASNPSLPDHQQMQNFQKQLGRLRWGKIAARLNPLYWLRVWQHTPFMATFEDQFTVRPGLRYTDVQLSYPEIMKRISRAKDLLKIPFFAVTVNYSPWVAVSLCPTVEECMDKNKKVSNICLPPVGTGPPAPMNAAHVEMLYNTIFVNLYGKHAAPRTHNGNVRVVGYAWDWTGMMKSYPPFFHVTQIQDKLFFSISAPPPDMQAIVGSKIFDDLGESQPYRHRPLYSRNATDTD
jgi:hypothetical protein